MNIIRTSPAVPGIHMQQTRFQANELTREQLEETEGYVRAKQIVELEPLLSGGLPLFVRAMPSVVLPVAVTLGEQKTFELRALMIVAHATCVNAKIGDYALSPGFLEPKTQYVMLPTHEGVARFRVFPVTWMLKDQPTGVILVQRVHAGSTWN